MILENLKKLGPDSYILLMKQAEEAMYMYIETSDLGYRSTSWDESKFY